MLKGIKVRLYPTKDQAKRIRQNIGNYRFVYNHMLALRIGAYEKDKTRISQFELNKMLPALKEEFEWLKDSDSTSLQQAIKDMDEAYQNFFRHHKGFPKFKKKRDGYGSFRTVMRPRMDGDKLRAGKHSNLTFRCSKKWRDLLKSSTIKSVTISMDAGLFYASCLVELSDPEPSVFKFSACGIDLGIKIPVALAYRKTATRTAYAKTGAVYTKTLVNKERRRARYQRQLARKKVGSNNFKKCKTKLQRAYKAERDYRNNFAEQVSHKLATTFALVAFEDLKLVNMTKSAQKNENGIRKGHAAKAGLNRSLLRNGMGFLMDRTEQKCFETGALFIKVDPKFTSQICSACGHKDKASRKSQARFVCTSCGYSKNADFNAARNILKRAA